MCINVYIQMYPWHTDISEYNIETHIPLPLEIILFELNGSLVVPMESVPLTFIFVWHGLTSEYKCKRHRFHWNYGLFNN